MYIIELRRKVQRSLNKLPKRDFDAVVETVKSLANAPRPKGVEKIKSARLWRVRRGDYRVVYHIDDSNSLLPLFVLDTGGKCTGNCSG